MVSVLVVEHDARLRLRLTRAISGEQLELAGQAGDVATGVGLAIAEQPNVLVLGSSVPFDQTLAALRRLREEASQVRTLLVRADADDARSVEALLAGASGVIDADAAPERLREAVLRLSRGEAVAGPQLQRLLVERFRRATYSWRGMRPLVSPLSNREWQVLDALREGASTQEVADQLGISRATVYSHLRNISRKLRTRSRQEALAVADELRRRAGMGDVGE